MVVVALPIVIVGVPPANVSELAAPGFSDQLCFVLLWSSNVRFPIVLATFSVTIASAGKLSVLKLAVLPAPSAIVPPLQFALLVQLPPFGFVHVPFAA